MRLSSWIAAIAAWYLPEAGILAAAPQGEVSITEYGAGGDGQELCTEAIDRALTACAEAGPGRVLVPAGTFLTGAVRLPGNVLPANDDLGHAGKPVSPAADNFTSTRNLVSK